MPRPLGLAGPDPRHHRLSLASTGHRMPDDYQPAERGHDNLRYVRHWRDQPGPSCVGHGVGQAYEIGKVRHGGSAIEAVSRLHLHTLGLLQQTPRGQRITPDGTYIGAVMAGLQSVGVCLEKDLPPSEGNVARRPPMEAEVHGFERAGGDFWQLYPAPGERLWREVCWAIDTFGAVVVGKLVGNVYMDHVGDRVLPAPGRGEVSLGGHCTVYVDYENYGANLIEDNSWLGWGFSRGVIGSDGKTRTVQSLARVSRDWLWSDWTMNAYVYVPRAA